MEISKHSTLDAVGRALIPNHLRQYVLLLIATVIACIPVVAGSVYDASPFSSSKESTIAGTTGGLLDPDRVNLWPVFYYDKPNASLFWPMVDWREDGHAFRPLYSFYNHYREWNILWPMIQLDFDRHEYFALNTWWDKNSVHSVPFLFYEKGDYWLAPLFAGRGSNWVSVMPPMTHFEWGCERTQWVFPLYYHRTTDDTRTFASLLGGWSADHEDRVVNLLGPLFNHTWNVSNTCARTDVLWPLAMRRIANNTFHLSVAPLFWHDRTADTSTQWMFPLYYYSRQSDARTFLSPLLSRFSDTDDDATATLLGGWGTLEKRRFINVLGPLFNHLWSASGDYVRTDLLFPLGGYRRDGNTRHVSALPLFWHDRSADATATYSLVSYGQSQGATFVNVLGPVFHYKTDAARCRSYLHAAWPLFSLDRGSNEFDICSFPLARYERTPDRLNTWVLWPMVQYEQHKDGNRDLCIFPLFKRETCVFPTWTVFHYPTDSWQRPRRWQDLKTALPCQTNHSTWVFPTWTRTTTFDIEKNGLVPIPPEIKADAKDMVDCVKAGNHRDIWCAYAARSFTVPTVTVEDSLWPVWDYKNENDQSGSFSLGLRLYQREWRAAISNALLPLAKSGQCAQNVQGTGRAATTNMSASSSWRVLWRVARSNRTGEDVSFESFPFVTYDRRPEKELAQFSVCWRLYRYRSEGRRRALDLFFIPIRWEKD